MVGTFDSHLRGSAICRTLKCSHCRKLSLCFQKQKLNDDCKKILLENCEEFYYPYVMLELYLPLYKLVRKLATVFKFLKSSFHNLMTSNSRNWLKDLSAERHSCLLEVLDLRVLYILCLWCHIFLCTSPYRTGLLWKYFGWWFNTKVLWPEAWCNGSCIEEEREGFVFSCLHVHNCIHFTFNWYGIMSLYKNVICVEIEYLSV
jgi:hypothetical protein